MSSIRQQLINSSKGLKERNMDLKAPSGSYPSYYTLPEGMSLWAPKHTPKGIEYYFDLVQFPFGPNFPNEPWKTAWKTGEWPYTMMVDIHKNIGPESMWVICPKSSYGERCPICEDLIVLQKNEPDSDLRKAIWMELRVSRRQWYYIVLRGTMEDGKWHDVDYELQPWEVPATSMQDKLDLIKYQGRSGEIIPYWDADDGRTVKATFKTKGEFWEWTGHGFEERIDPDTKKKYVIEDEFIEQAAAYPLDKVLKRMTYDELAEVYFSKGAGKKKQEEEEQPPPSRRTRGTTQEPPKEDPPDEEAPPARRRRGAATEPEQPKEGVCPHGGVFGVNTLKIPACNDCDDAIYKACEAEMERLKAEEPPVTRRRRR